MFQILYKLNVKVSFWTLNFKYFPDEDPRLLGYSLEPLGNLYTPQKSSLATSLTGGVLISDKTIFMKK